MQPSPHLPSTPPVRQSSIQEITPRGGVAQQFSSVLMYAAPMAAVPAVVLGVAGLFGAGPSWLRRHPLVSAALACGGMGVLVKSQLDRFFQQHPDYDVIAAYEDFEVRQYHPRAVAETVIETPSFEEAKEVGFRRLAAYIFGENVPGVRLPMTAPLSIEQANSEVKGERIAMTSPVTLKRSRAGFVMRFQMPKERNLSSLPAPLDPRIQLRKVSGERVAAIKFRGTYDAERIASKQKQLVALARAHGIAVAGEPVFAGYDSPATLPFIRRVEVWVPVARV